MGRSRKKRKGKSNYISLYQAEQRKNSSLRLEVESLKNDNQKLIDQLVARGQAIDRSVHYLFRRETAMTSVLIRVIDKIAQGESAIKAYEECRLTCMRPSLLPFSLRVEECQRHFDPNDIYISKEIADNQALIDDELKGIHGLVDILSAAQEVQG